MSSSTLDRTHDQTPLARTSRRARAGRRISIFLLVLAASFGFSLVPAYAAFVPIPANYVYDTSQGAWHDYCTLSPDVPYVPPGSNVDFRGPCARHDMCEENGGKNTYACDRLFFNLVHEQCAWAFAADNPHRGPCDFISDTYYNTVRETG